MKEEGKQKRDWIDLALKALTPLVAGLLIAWAGVVGDKMLSSISSRQESARLITELQIKREQAESELRKDVFDQALNAFLLKKIIDDDSLRSLSKQLLQLELLALNFGDSLSLSPLFSEFRKDLGRFKPDTDEDKLDYDERRGQLYKRLNSLAKRVASSQLSSIAQHGEVKKIRIPLFEYKQIIEQLGDGKKNPCNTRLFESDDYAWPAYEVLDQMWESEEDFNPFQKSEWAQGQRGTDAYKDIVKETGLIALAEVRRSLTVNVSEVDHCRKTAKVQIRLTREGEQKPEVDRNFRLDYFNFPMVDNTRLSDNQRFAIVMEDFEVKSGEPHINISGVVFPSEYASLRDRPGMQEARKLLESAMAENGERDE